MGSATTQALATTTAELTTANVGDLTVARELFAAAREIADSAQLSGALSAWGAPAEARAQVATVVFAAYSPVSVRLLSSAVSQRWSSTEDLVSGIEELAIRAAAIGAPSTDVEGELFQLVGVVAANPELELALGSRLGDAAAKGALIEKLLGGRAGEATALVASQLVQQPRERRVRFLLNRALHLVADQRGKKVATVRVANALDATQQERLASALSTRYGVDVTVNVIVDPQVLGGMRVEIGDDVIDGTVSSRINDLRQRLAG
ncbi:ATP synthase F1, delta subunit [Microbacterium sp. oral taxon 186 str. F0373]|jgi:F-type H+-transporting ATPase subunit delta|uniref:F0F1 ATP synthase subunit delta n=1 Tax=Microbacterium sp. oral taxon 186 TaxID=712383 RepID=UPI0002588648|nr:F0F1 ATP synthase subunit delta [Microbacterium sp. oral taxon 186]EIC09188.1 ATP synthase subunit delta [Microbacterium laevaniformans OR221]EPD86625.1 ATP synthase F1, delta subunit [Microbacterium sp. oral taxon 186 str. F0373]